MMKRLLLILVGIAFLFQTGLHADSPMYLVVYDLDKMEWKVRYTNEEPDLNKDVCRTTELWLRQIPAGTFKMGSPKDEVGRFDDEKQHEVTITKRFYIGVFECTQRQWELVMGNKPSYFNNTAYYATRPVEQVCFNTIRGTGAETGGGWPAFGHTVDGTSFMGKLKMKTGLIFDLPTEAQWEYACRAGTTSALNSGKNLVSIGEDDSMSEVGRYWSNGGSNHSQDCTTANGTAKVGSYKPNAWGLYDMHGNVWEWCLDWIDSDNPYDTLAVTDPVGDSRGTTRAFRGGYWDNGSRGCRSAVRNCGEPWYTSNSTGFRVVCLP